MKKIKLFIMLIGLITIIFGIFAESSILKANQGVTCKFFFGNACPLGGCAQALGAESCQMYCKGLEDPIFCSQ